MDKVRMAIVGCGRISNMNVPGYLQDPNCHVYAICDPLTDRASDQARKWRIEPRIYPSFDQVLNDPNIDAIELLTPIYMHADQVVAALEAGKHVSCQKPMCNTVAEADRIIAAAEKANTYYRVTENFFFYPPIEKAKELIDEGAIGEPSLVRIHTTRGGSVVNSHLPPDDNPLAWKRDPSLAAGGMLFDDGVHKLATAMKWIGEIETVQGIVRRPTEGGAARDWHMEAPIAAIWKYKDRECLGVLDETFGYEMPIRSTFGRSDNYFEIHGSKGVIHVTRCTGEIMDLPPVLLVTGTETIPYDVPHIWSEGFDRSAKHFVNSILAGTQPDLEAHFAKKTVQTALAIYRAAETGQAVDVDSYVD